MVHMSIQNMTLLDFTWYFKYNVGIRTATLDGQPGTCPHGFFRIMLFVIGIK